MIRRAAGTDVDTISEIAAIFALGYERLLAASLPDDKPNHDKLINTKHLRCYSLDTSSARSDQCRAESAATHSSEGT
jgi:hypothetical protein